MRYTLLIVLSCLVMNGIAQTNYPNGVSGCLARWNFTSSGPITSLPDVSGNNHNGTATSLIASNGFRNLANKAMTFNGTSSYALVPHDPVLNPSQITIIALVKLNGFYNGNCQGNNIIYKSYAYYNNPGCWAMQIEENDNNCSTFSPGYEQLEFAGPASPPYTFAQANFITTNNWYFLAISYDGNAIKRYQVIMDPNNYAGTTSPISTDILGTALGSNTYDVRIGATQNPPFPYWFNGDMDEVALFNRVLSDSEIHAVYTYLWGQLTVDVSNTTILCDSVSVNYTVYNPDIFQGNNVFTAQLSDASGSFASPVTIGSVTSVTSGTIACTIPGTAQGTGYRIRVVASNSAFTSPDNGSDITIYPVANMHPNILQSGMTLSLPLNYSTYQWFHNNSPISPGGTNATYTATQAGSYFVRITNDNGCVGYSDTIYIWAAGVQNTNSTPATIKVYPNPAKNMLNLSYSNITDGRIEIMDMTGRTLMSKKLGSTIDISKLANGVYMYRVYEGDISILNGKLIKE